MQDKPRYTFHYTPEEYFTGLDPAADYVPPEFEEDGFIHCTDGAENVARVATAYFRYDERRFLVLYIDKTLVTSPIKYEDPGEIYPHIYGPLQREAIVRVLAAWRDYDGFFLPMPDM
jgi:uncharacterized protein (DUF952 family)